MISTTIKDTSKAQDYVIRQYNSKDVIQVLFQLRVLFQTGTTSNRYIESHVIKSQVVEDICDAD